MKKKTLLIACIALVAVILGASVLYNNLSQSVETPGLAAVQTTAPSESTQPIPEAPDETEAPVETQAPTEATEPDYSAPDFTMTDWDGNAVNLSDFEGKPVILNFWASWCGPCKSEMPEFEAAYQKYGEDIHFVMVNCTVGDDIKAAKKMITDSGYTFPVYFDTTNAGSYAYGVNSIPMTIFIDANGDMATYAMGALPGELLEKGISYIYTEE